MRSGMSRAQSPSPRTGFGWSRSEDDRPHVMMSGHSSPIKSYGQSNGNPRTVTWTSAKARSEGVNGYPSFSTRKKGFFGRHYRRLSGSLPRFHMGGGARDYAEKEKLGRGRWCPGNGSVVGNLTAFAGKVLRRMRLRFLLVIAILLATLIFYVTRKFSVWQRAGP